MKMKVNNNRAPFCLSHLCRRNCRRRLQFSFVFAPLDWRQVELRLLFEKKVDFELRSERGQRKADFCGEAAWVWAAWVGSSSVEFRKGGVRLWIQGLQNCRCHCFQRFRCFLLRRYQPLPRSCTCQSLT